MRVLVVGGGSIGSRHLRNLRTLGVDQLGLAEPDAGRRRGASAESGAAGFETFEEGLAWGPRVAVIATPTHLHRSQALEAARAGCHLFIEKPLSHTLAGLGELMREATSRGLISMIGCNMRFHPGPARVKSLLEQSRVGRVLFARIHHGSYLPSWRPETDYRVSYSARASMGGGCILDCIHELDLARWYLGEIEAVLCRADRLGTLEIDVEDYAALLCRHRGGAASEIHVDYLQQSYERGCQIVGETGSISWDFRDGTVRVHDATSGAWERHEQSPGWDLNQMYLDELSHFLDCVQTGKPSVFPLEEASAVLQVAIAAKSASDSGRMMHPSQLPL